MLFWSLSENFSFSYIFNNIEDARGAKKISMIQKLVDLLLQVIFMSQIPDISPEVKS